MNKESFINHIDYKSGNLLKKLINDYKKDKNIEEIQELDNIIDVIEQSIHDDKEMVADWFGWNPEEISDHIPINHIQEYTFFQLIDFVKFVNRIKVKDILKTELEYATRRIEYYTSIVRSGIITLSEMECDEYEAFLYLLPKGERIKYALACGVEEDMLNGDIMYKKYHTKEIRNYGRRLFCK